MQSQCGCERHGEPIAVRTSARKKGTRECNTEHAHAERSETKRDKQKEVACKLPREKKEENSGCETGAQRVTTVLVRERQKGPEIRNEKEKARARETQREEKAKRDKRREKR